MKLKMDRKLWENGKQLRLVLDAYATTFAGASLGLFQKAISDSLIAN